MLKKFAAALGLAEDASEEQVIQALSELKAKAEAPATQSKEYADLKTHVQTLEGQLKVTDEALATEKRVRKVEQYTKEMEGLKAISGDPRALAEGILNLEEQSPEAAWQMACTYADANRRLLAAGILEQKGTSAEGEAEHPFIQAVKAYQAEHLGTTEAEAFAKVSDLKPELYRQYRKAK